MGKKNLSLKDYNTFGIDVPCSKFISVLSVPALQNILKTNYYQNAQNYFVLGGGSNILLKDAIVKTVLYNQIKGIQIEETQGKESIVSVGGGEIWHEFVLWCLKNNFGGVENLSLIPGSAGAAPIQNIGAYGVELKDVFYKLEAVILSTGELQTFYKEDCHFDYRFSVFKAELKGKYFISKVFLKLTNTGHQVNTSYGAIQEELESQGILNPGIQDVSHAVIKIRKSKLPDPKVIGNSGSFFKNPVIDEKQLARLKINFPDIKFYPFGDHQFKLAAGWLIEKAGWKGKRIGETGCYKDQALVIVNYGNASGREIFEHAQRVIESVRDNFGVSLEPEVNIYPN